MTKKLKNDTDIVKESAKTGEMTTDSGRKVDATGPAVPDSALINQLDDGVHNNRILTPEEEEKYAGELQPGDSGYLPLNPDGSIAGPAKLGNPPEGMLAAKVTGVAPTTKPTTLQTPAGAPISHTMNPSTFQSSERPKNG